MVPDQDILQGCLQGRRDAWASFVDRFSKLIYWSIHKTFGGTEYSSRADLVNEVFQEVFENLLVPGKLAKLRRVEGLKKFLIVTASHAAMDKMKSLSRHQKKFELMDETHENLSDLLPDSQALSQEASFVINETLQGLPSRERVCVQWHYMEGKTHREIGLILGMPEGTVTTVIARTREKLKKRFERMGLAEEL